MPVQPVCRLLQYGCLECHARQITCHCLPSTKYKHPTSAMIDSRSPSNYREAVDLPEPPNTQDLELTAQWCTATYRSIATSTSVERIWQAAVPEEAIAHPFLTHGLWALSALHVASTSDDHAREEYIKTAQNHHSKAMNGFQKAAKVLDKSTSAAAFAMCHVDLVFSFALPLTTSSNNSNDDNNNDDNNNDDNNNDDNNNDDNNNDTNPIDTLCDILTHIQTSSPILTAASNNIPPDSALSPLLPHPSSSTNPALMPNTSQLAITSLTRLNNTLSQQDPTHETDIYAVTIAHLASSLDTLLRTSTSSTSTSTSEGSTPLATTQWTYHVPAEFIPLARRRRPFALVLLAHYAVMLHAVRKSWWMGGWGERVIRECGLALGGALRGAMGWVVDATGVFIS